MVQQFLTLARQDESVFITDVRRAFQQGGTRPFHLHVELYSGEVRSFPLMLPVCENEAETAFAADYIHAMVYNILSSLGSAKLTVYLDPADEEAARLAAGLDTVFQLHAPKTERFGYGKCLNVNERVLSILSGGAKQFAFCVEDIAAEPELCADSTFAQGAPVFEQLPAIAADKMLLGIDIGGTDIKFSSSVNGKLALCKEFDWNPIDFPSSKEFLEPILLLTRLMRAGTALFAMEKDSEIVKSAFLKEATAAEMEAAACAMEAVAGASLSAFDGIGLSFPDVVIRNRIVGGETTKTRGMRENPALDYEADFLNLTDVCETLKAYTVPGGKVMACNDGPMSAFTTAVEQAAVGMDLSRGVFAYSLGTELGTGWLLPDGSIPAMPLEVYNFIVDLGSYQQKTYDCMDIRSTRNVNTNLPGSLQKYTGQSGVFRLAAKWLPEKAPEILRQAEERNLFAWDGERFVVPTQPEDMRKACLEFFMEKAAAGEPTCQEIFRTIGQYLAVTWAENQDLLSSPATERTLFGRLVKRQECFRLMCEGAAQREPSLVLHAADSALANTPLMQQLEQHPDYTVAQFAQAIGAIYYSCI